jgi:hypothetical protein
LKLLLISGKSALMFPATANGKLGQFWNEGDLMWQRATWPL